MTAFLALVKKDLLLFVRDKRAMIMSFVAPIVIASFFAWIFGGSGGQKINIQMGLVDEDASDISRAIVAKAPAEGLDVKPMARAEAEKAVREGKLSVAAILPKGFGEQAAKCFFRPGLPKAELEILFDPARATERQMVEGVLTGRIMEAVSGEVFGGRMGRQMIADTLKDLEASTTVAGELKGPLDRLLKGAQELNLRETSGAGRGARGGLSVPFTTKARAATAAGNQREWNGAGHYFGGMGVQFILFLGIEAGVSLLLQRQMGLWKRLRCAPVSRGVLMGSKAASSAICAFAILVVLFSFAHLTFRVPLEGSLAGFTLVAIAFAMMTASYGLLISAVGRTPEAARPISIIATLMMVMLGGSWIPTFLFPAWLQKATLVMPTRWAVDGLDAMTWRGLGFEAALLPAAVITGFAVVFASIAWVRFEWDS